MKIKWSVFSVLAFLVMSSALTAQSKRSHSSEQLAFSAEEDTVKRPVAIPQDVLAILARDEMVRNELENEELPVEKIPLSWFSLRQFI
jgi:hypothetical protein